VPSPPAPAGTLIIIPGAGDCWTIDRRLCRRRRFRPFFYCLQSTAMIIRGDLVTRWQRAVWAVGEHLRCRALFICRRWRPPPPLHGNHHLFGRSKYAEQARRGWTWHWLAVARAQCPGPTWHCCAGDPFTLGNGEPPFAGPCWPRHRELLGGQVQRHAKNEAECQW